MKQYKAVLAIIGNNDAMDLVNIHDPEDRIMAAEDQFTVGEIVNEKDFELKNHSYVDDESAGSGLFAFKKQEDEQPL